MLLCWFLCPNMSAIVAFGPTTGQLRPQPRQNLNFSGALCIHFSQYVHQAFNEPTITLCSVKEHVRQTVPQLMNQQKRFSNLLADVHEATVDTHEAINFVQQMNSTVVQFQSINATLA